MPNSLDNPANISPYILEGRVVTMGPQGVLPRGAVYIHAGRIEAVQPAHLPPPCGYAAAPRLRTRGSIYPGLVELHNHLAYNALPLWDVPKRYSNNSQWKTHPDYRRLITKPAQVLGRSPGVVEAVVRFTECRCLLGGVTTTQGITLVGTGGLVALYHGVVRNVERTDDPALPDAGTRIANPNVGEAEAYLRILAGQTCYLQHLSEGVDDTARQWFHRLRLPDGDWALTPAFSGIHSAALGQPDLAVIAAYGGSVVWSPLSNYLLYGDTLDLWAARHAGVLMGLGSDWAPSGSKNLLGELKVAWLANQTLGEPFSAQEIVAMATANAARILRWDGELGAIEPGKRADLLVIAGQQGDDYERLIRARETDISLVLIEGIARYGLARLMVSFGAGTEKIRVGRAPRVLNLNEPGSHPLLQGLTLREATRRLRRAMADLPALAQALDEGATRGAWAGSRDASGMRWQLALDFDVEEPEYADTRSLADVVQPMMLEDITVADDGQFLDRVAHARNVPAFVKRELAALY
jgi:5-methylthioadenosine/S-adenosylhomocysteine deaminase